MNIRYLLLLTSLTVFPMSLQAGFAESMRELRYNLGQLNETTRMVSDTAKGLKSSQHNVTSQQVAWRTGQQLRPKINNLPLYQAAHTSSNVVHQLAQHHNIVFLGSHHANGLIEVATDYGNGWVEKHLVQ